MKIIITMILSASFIAASSGTTAEEGLMKAIDKLDNTPKPLILVNVVDRAAHAKHISELHGDLKRQTHLAKFKTKLRKQENQRRLGLSVSKITNAY